LVCHIKGRTQNEGLANRILGKKILPKVEIVTGGWKLVHEEFHKMYSSQNIIRIVKLRRLRCGWACNTIGEDYKCK
jgi:hypothetical protein